MQYCIDKYNYNQIKKIIMAKIYVASSWRNVFQQDVVGILRDLGHEVYDLRILLMVMVASNGLI